MLNKITYSCTALNGLNKKKQGLLKQEADGYYRVVLGALNAYNSIGDLYPYEPAKALFEASGALKRRIARGALRAENGHPKWEPAMSEEQYACRVMEIRESRVCAHIKQIDLVFDKYRDEKGRPIIGIEGYVAPSGELGYVLEKALVNPNENIAFSIRSFTENIPTFSGVHRVLKNIVTWDYVGEPGIAQAEKYYSPALENKEDKVFNRATLEHAFYNQSPGFKSASMESVRLNADELFQSLGWVSSNESKPSYLKW